MERILCIIILLLVLGLQVQGAEVVRVRLFSVPGSQLVARGQNIKLSTGQRALVPASHWSAFTQINVSYQKIKISGSPLWTVVPQQGQRQEYKGAYLNISAESLQLGISPVPKQVMLYPNEKGGIDIITEVDMEAYLFGVLASEMPLSWPIDALKAQAVATRTYTLNALRSAQQDSYFHLETSILDQVFKHPEQLNLAPVFKAKILKVIRETKGQYLVTQTGEILKAYYHSDCGGQTEVAGYVWDGAEGAGVAQDNYCSQSHVSHWNFKMSWRGLTHSLRGPLGLGVEDEIYAITPKGKTPSGRNHYVIIKFRNLTSEQVGLKLVHTQKLREWVGFTKIKSTRFILATKKSEVLFKGKGNGHGVGLCQWGARSMALQKQDYRAILKHYYPKAHLLIPLSPKRPLAKARKLAVDA